VAQSRVQGIVDRGIYRRIVARAAIKAEGVEMAGKTFTAGSAVAWSHKVAPMHSGKSVLFASAVKAVDADATFGTIIGPANEVGTQWEVAFGDDSRVLTSDELVLVEDN
jgi:hypothetical protein